MLEAVDAVHSTETGREYILEVNDTSVNFGPNHEEEDLQILKNLTLQRMKEAFEGKQYAKATDEKRVDSSSLYKKLEAELINADNAK